MAEQYITLFREYSQNGENVESQFIKKVIPLNDEIDKLYREQGDFPIAPSELHEWEQLNNSLAGFIHDFTLFYSANNSGSWSKKDKIFLMKQRIKYYHETLEKLKEIENNILAVASV